MAVIKIQGISCSFRDLLTGEEILYSEYPKEQQYFRRLDHPFTNEDELVEIATAPYDERKSKCNKLQVEWVEREEKRMTYGNGVYASINGTVTYIPASYWGYVNYWELEHGEMPEYREADRIFFLFMEYICFETDVLAVTRGKGRRQGATSLGFYWMWWICGRQEEKRGGSISFNDDAAKKNFQTMFMRGFKSMLPCFVRDFDSTADNFVRFVKPVEKAKKGVIKKRQGLNSYCDNLANSINAYDSGRLSFGLFDESGKYEKMDINTYWSKVSPTLKQGRNKVGFAYLPTTVNPAQKGGENFEKFWQQADQNAINPNTGEPYGLNTPHKIVRYFVPATEGYAGCIDMFGNSVIENPLIPIMGNDGKMITEGSLSVIMNDRSLKTGEQLLEHRRDFPLDQYDMFSFQFGMCEFNEDNLMRELKRLKEDPVYLRQSRLIWKEIKERDIYSMEITRRVVDFMDDAKGGWFILEKPNKPNSFILSGDNKKPTNKIMYQIGVDTTQDRIAENGSCPVIIVFKKSCIISSEGQMIETGMYPVAMWISPTRLDIHFDEEVLKACMWYGCCANYENDRRNDFIFYFSKMKASQFLDWTPSVFQNPNKRGGFKPEVGSRSGDGFQLGQQLQLCKMYIDGTDNEIFNGHVHRIQFPTLLNQLLKYDHNDRTKSDQVVALMMALAPVLGEMQKPILPQRKTPLFPTYTLKIA